MAYLIAFVLYAHVVPEGRSLGTALLAGVSVVSIILGLAAQSTLGYTILRDAQGNEVIVPNSVMVSNVVIRLAKTKSRDRLP
ncbi:MAG TPA: hypothetical protein VEQ87_08925 [Burkholderiales bacterium]|nr:hypothetical protein [Burkholderiales bacterium]